MRMTQRGAARRRGSKEHCAINVAEEHGLLEAEYRAN